MTIARSSGFLRAYKKLISGRPELEALFRERLSLFMVNPFDPKLATHKLKGKLSGSLAFSLNWKLRVVFFVH